MSDQDKTRAAIGRMAVRLRDNASRSGKPITHTQARDQAREIAKRVDRKKNQ